MLQICCGSFTGEIKLLDFNSGVCNQTMTVSDSQINRVKQVPYHTRIAAATNPNIYIFDIVSDNSSPLDIFAEHRSNVTSISFFPKSKDLMLTSSEDKSLRLWDTRQGDSTLAQTVDNPLSDGVVVDGIEKVAVADHEGFIYFYDLRKSGEGNEIEKITTSRSIPLTSISVSEDRNYLMASNFDGLVFVYKKDETGGYKLFKKLEAHNGYCLKSIFSKDSNHIFTASADKTVKMWAVAETEITPVRTMAAHTDWVWDLALTAGGAKMVSGSADCFAVVWDVASGVPQSLFRAFDLSVAAVTIV